MNKQGCFFWALLLGSSLLTGCLSSAWTGAQLLYDRHDIYKKVDDYQLAANANRALYKDRVFKQKGCVIDLAVFNRDILVAGHVPTLTLRQEAIARLSALSGYRRLFNQLDISNQAANTVADSWITMKIRSKIFTDATIDPDTFKIVTADSIVYLMGDVIPKQATLVIDIARKTDGVVRVVKLLKYYNLSDHATINA